MSGVPIECIIELSIILWIIHANRNSFFTCFENSNRLGRWSLLRVVLVDDEQLAVDMLEILLNRIGDVEVKGTYTNPEDLIKEIEQVEIDAVFLDMEMGPLHGLKIAKEFKAKRPHIEIIFVTAHAQFAVGAFEVKAFDYLLKPVRQERLEETINQLREKRGIPTKVKTDIEPKRKFLSARTMGSFHLIDSENNEVKWRTKKVKELFIYLWHHSPTPVHRSRILADLWGDHPEDRAAPLMHTTLYQLRKTIKDIGYNNPIKLINEQYIFNMHIKSDLNELEQITNSSDTMRDNVKTVISLYRGNYLEEENYDWALINQRKVKGASLEYLGKYLQSEMENEEPSHLIETCLEKMLKLEPYNERFVYLLVDYYGKTKNIQKIVAVIEWFKKMWAEELGIDIPEEIYNIYNEHITYT